MKKNSLFIILFITFYSFSYSQVYRYIPDVRFRTYLRNTLGLPFNATLDSLKVSDPSVINTTTMQPIGLMIESVKGIEYFPNLNMLRCGSNLIVRIDSLPPSLNHLNCATNRINYLPTLPSGLTYLDCSENGDSLKSLPDLPNKLQYLHCSYNNLTELPHLPDSLFSITSGMNKLKYYPQLPLNLNYFEGCCNDSLISLPDLPQSLVWFDCHYCRNITCLPYLPSNITNILYDNTNISCFPNYISNRTSYTPAFGTYPLCNPYTSICPAYTSIDGHLYYDNNSNCHVDSNEIAIYNQSINLMSDSGNVQSMTSYLDGLYSFSLLPNGRYIVSIDSSNIPFQVSCPASGYDTINIDSSHLYHSNHNFGFQCKSGFDIGTIGLINRTNTLRPLTNAHFELHAGDMACINGVHCTNISGKITINYSGHLRYNGSEIGSLLPDTILPNHLVWNIADFSTLDFFNSIKPIFFIDSSAVLGDIICFNTEITPNIGDRIPSNNSMNQCFNIVASFDPNYKEVNPSGSVTASQDWLYYTIHFQNTGSSYAENIYVWDTIDQSINISSIQIIGSSHNQFMQVNPNSRAVRFNFLNINLPDSTTDEPASHGWVKYRVKLNDSLSEGTQIQNTASIYFDLNAPILTNTTFTNICNSPSMTSQNITLINGQSINVGSSNYNQSGLYTNIFSNINGCDSIVNTTIQIVSSINDLEPINLLIYPNPVNNLVQIQIEGIANNHIQIFDMYGREVYNSETITNKLIINTESFISGNYVVKYGTHHQKLIINH